MSAYKISYKHNWLDEICSHMTSSQKPNGYWNYDKCKEISKNYTSISSFIKDYNGAYASMKRNGWVEEFFTINQTRKINQNYVKIQSPAK